MSSDFTATADPISLFSSWLDEARASEPNDPNAMALATNSAVVQVIGHTATFFRENPDFDKKRGAIPPWRK
jgi:pyridoxine/pyridoxamine 5'-phosphate oxidase